MVNEVRKPENKAICSYASSSSWFFPFLASLNCLHFSSNLSLGAPEMVSKGSLPLLLYVLTLLLEQVLVVESRSMRVT